MDKRAEQLLELLNTIDGLKNVGNHREVTTTTTTGKTEQIIIPESMNKLQASQQLKKQWDEEETMVDLVQIYDKWDPNDTTVAIMKTLKRVFGWVAGQPIVSFFGVKNPAEINVAVDIVNGREVYESCFLGQFGVAQWENATGNVARNATVTQLAFTLKKKYVARAKQFFVEVEETLRTSSIYKGKSLMLDDKGFSFVENKGSKDIILNSDEERVIENLVIAPLGNKGKRCILFTGPYGTGKTETAMRVGREANLRGITYIYCKDAKQFSRLLNIAKQYQPAVVFLEDIDEIGSGEQRDASMNDILNTLDGVQTKGNNITVIFTTNHEKRINPALRRPGRIDIILKFNKCEKNTIKKIYDRLFSKFPGAENLDTEMLSYKTPEVQGAVVAEIAQRAKCIAEATPELIVTNDIVLTAITSMKDQIEFMEENPENVADKRITAIETIAEEVAKTTNFKLDELLEMHR